MTKLLLAEGDFSYAVTFIGHQGPLVACGYDLKSEALVKYPGMEERLEKLNSMKNAAIAHNVDATKTMHKGALPPLATNIDSIEIRYPHTGVKSVMSNRILLTGMITACTRLMVSPLCVDGCTLSISLKTTGRYNEWAGDITPMARNENLVLQSVGRPTNPEGYEHVQTNGRDIGVQMDQACTWVFVRKEFCESPLEVLPDWLADEVGERCDKCEVRRREERRTGGVKRQQKHYTNFLQTNNLQLVASLFAPLFASLIAVMRQDIQ